MSDDDLPDDADQFADAIPVYSHSIPMLLGLEHLRDALPRKAKRAIDRDEPVVVVIETASEAWTRRIESAVSEVFSVKLISAAKAPNRSSVPETPAIMGATVAVSQNLAWLSPALVAAADFSIAIRAKTTSVEAVIKAVCGRRAKVEAADIAGLDVLDLATAIRPGSARACVERMRRAAASRACVSSDDRTPTLERLAGYGAALDQVRAIAADVALVRSGVQDTVTAPSALFFGPPGTGKTTLVRSFAKSTGLPLVATSVADWFTSSDGALGGVAKSLQSFFESATARAPCVAFMDELDALPDRAQLDARGRDWWTPIVTGVLLQIDRIRAQRMGVVLMAATNHLYHIDAALKRPGRFDRHIEICGPRDAAELAEVLRQHLDEDLKGVDLEAVARLGPGATGAAAELWVQTARRSARAAGRPVRLSDLVAAISPPDVRTRQELRLCALHEAAHAVVGHVLGMPLRAVSIVENAQAGGSTSFGSGGNYRTRAELEAHVTTVFAGRAADELWSGGAHSGAAHDLKIATQMLVAVHGVFGLGERLTSLGGLDQVDSAILIDAELRKAVEADSQRLMAQARTLVARHADAIHRLAKRLMADRVATPSDVERAFAAPTSKAKSPPKSHSVPGEPGRPS